MKTRPTIYDVAQRAKVSMKTVSRVINHELSVSDHTRQRVTEAIAALGWQPNLSARSLYFQYYHSVLFRDAPFVSRIALMYLKCDAHCCPCFMFKGNRGRR